MSAHDVPELDQWKMLCIMLAAQLDVHQAAVDRAGFEVMRERMVGHLSLVLVDRPGVVEFYLRKDDVA